MISQRRCPHTGVVCFFVVANPLITVGSVNEGAANHYYWHCCLDDPINGTASDMTVAEAELKAAIARRRHRPVSNSLTSEPDSTRRDTLVGTRGRERGHANAHARSASEYLAGR